MKRTGQDTQKIGENLARLRRIYGLSQREVGEALQTSFQQIQKYEKGQNRIPAEKLHRLKEFFDVPYDLFFTGLEGGARQPWEQKCLERLQEIRDPALKQKLFQMLMILTS